MRDQEIITITTPISQVVEVLQAEPYVAHPGDSIYTLALKMASNPVIRVVCVVDSQNVLIGLVPLRLVLEGVFYQATSEEQVTGSRTGAVFPQAARCISPERAGEMMEAPVWVRMGDTVKNAVDKMFAAHLDGLPIVDDDMRVVGYVDAVDLLRLWIGATR